MRLPDEVSNHYCTTYSDPYSLHWISTTWRWTLAYSKVKLPPAFERKIDIDNQIQELVSSPVIFIPEYQKLKSDQELVRYSCIKTIEKQKGI